MLEPFAETDEKKFSTFVKQKLFQVLIPGSHFTQ